MSNKTKGDAHMAQTKIRASQFKQNDITSTQLADNSVYLNNIFSTPQQVASSSGVLALPTTSNSFIATGTDVLMSITGIQNGLISIKWQDARSIIHTAGTLELVKGVSHDVAAGDVSLFVFRNGVPEEISCKTNTTEQSNRIYEFNVAGDKTDFVLSEAPKSANNVLVLDNGVLQSSTSYTVASKTITLATACETGDIVTVIVMEKMFVPSTAGIDVIDGGTF